tara:strand:+ start:1800 stop:2429 length:630 start_codon:yes stop_codon:yes gene_type:complete
MQNITATSNNITARDNTKLTFTTTKKGRPDLKADGGTIRGRHTVQVDMLVGTDHKTIAGLDLVKVETADRTKLKTALESRGLVFTDLDFNLALEGDLPRKKGVLTALRQSATGTNADNKHLDAYSDHPCGVRGVSIHDGTGDVHVRGIIIGEKIISADPNGNARKTKSGLHVQLKNAISKELDLTSRKWRQYKLPADATVNGIDNPTSL